MKYTPPPDPWLDPHGGLNALLCRVLANPRAEGSGHQAGSDSCQTRVTGPRARDPFPKNVDTAPSTGDGGMVMSSPHTMAELVQRRSAEWTKV